MVESGTALRAEVLTFALAYTNVMLIPGPSFVVVCEAGLLATPREARLVALGVAFGASALASVILRIAPMLQASPSLMIAGRISCALILLVMGFKVFRRSQRGARKVVRSVSAVVARERVMTGFVAAATNPISFASFTTAALAIGQADQPIGAAAVVVTIFLMALGWFSALATLFSHPVLTARYDRVATTLGTFMGCVLMAKAITALLAAL